MITDFVDQINTRLRGIDPSWADGNSDDFFFRLKKIELQDGSIIEPQVAGVTVIVGANNAGKSTILKEIRESVDSGHPALGLSVLSTEVEKTSQISDVFAWLAHNAAYVPVRAGINSNSFMRSNSTVAWDHVPTFWNSRQEALHTLAPFMYFFGDATGRFSLGATAPKRAETTDPPTHPVHYLEENPELVKRLSSISEKVFQQSLTVDALSGNVQIRVGSTELQAPPVDAITKEYRQAIGNLPLLDNQGDGMRSFFAQILPILAANYPMVMLDEPEAFLHPPQARALGVELGKLAKERNVQVIVATHDRNFVTGLLESDSDVSVVRVSRPNNSKTQALQLDAEKLKEIWHDPVLRYTNVLESLFHKIVVLGESEIDCAYLAATLDYSLRPTGKIPNSEFLFVQTGGKAGFPKVAEALSAVGVPIVAAPDFDLFRDEAAVKKLVSALGGTWDENLSNLWRRAMHSFLQPRRLLTIGAIIHDLQENFKDQLESVFDAESKKTMLRLTRAAEAPFDEVKRHGLAAFTGEQRQHMNNLLAEVAKFGISPVHEGELERLAPDVAAGKGIGWLTEALQNGKQGNSQSQQHLDRIVGVAERLLFAS